MPSQGSKMPCSVGLLAHVCVSRRAPHRSSFTPGSKAGDFSYLAKKTQLQVTKFLFRYSRKPLSCGKETAHLQKEGGQSVLMLFSGIMPHPSKQPQGRFHTAF